MRCGNSILMYIGRDPCTDSTPLSGVGLSNLVWRGTTTESWMIRFDSVTKTRYAVRVG